MAPGADSDGDGLPDTGPLAAGATRCIVVEVRIPAGTAGLQDVTTVEACEPATRATTSCTATDRTSVGTVTLERSATGRAVAGNRADYALVASNDGAPGAIQFSLIEGRTAAPQVVALTTSNGEAADYRVSDDASWLAVAPEGGQTPGQLTVSVDSAGLAPGDYTATITVAAEWFVSTTCTVQLTVLPTPAVAIAANPKDPVGTPSTPRPMVLANIANDPMLVSLAVGLNRLDSASVPYDATLGTVQVYQPSGGVPPGGTPVTLGPSFPWHGGNGDIDGAFNAVDTYNSRVQQDTRLPRINCETVASTGGLCSTPGLGWQIAYGTSWHFGLGFTDDGPRALGLISYLQSSDAESQFFNDQSQRYSEKNMRQIPFSEAEIEAALRQLSDVDNCCLIVTTGGTGPALRDVAPEATEAVCEKPTQRLTTRRRWRWHPLM